MSSHVEGAAASDGAAEKGFMNAGKDPLVQEALLRDPDVQQAIRQAGANGLSDPTVQDAIVKACKQKFPSVAEEVAGQVSEWGHNSELQQKAFRYASDSFKAVASAGQELPERIISYIEQGPAGVRFLAFVGGVGQAGLATCDIASSILFLGPLFHPVEYVVHAYQFLFGLTTMLFELNPSWVARFRILDVWQNLLIDEARFITKTRGRGIAYLFLGSLWLFQSSSIESVLPLCVGLYMAMLGLMHILISFGYTHRNLAAKLRDGVGVVKTFSNNVAGMARQTFGQGSRSPRQSLNSQPHEVELPEAKGPNYSGTGDL